MRKRNNANVLSYLFSLLYFFFMFLLCTILDPTSFVLNKIFSSSILFQGKEGFEHVLSVGIAMHLGYLDDPLLADVILVAPAGCEIPIALNQVRP
jgi:hypothetical protein